MGKCKYCGNDAGWFSSAHSACQDIHDKGKNELLNILMSSFRSKEDFYLKASKIDQIIRDSYISNDVKENVFIEALDKAIDEYLNDGIIDNAEKSTVARYIQFSNIPQSTLNKNHSIEKMLQSDVIQDILNGNTPVPKIKIEGNFPFLLQKNESIVWMFRNIVLHEQKIKREYVGRNRGMSFRICKGVYYRTGGFKGHPIETTIMQRISVGTVCLTTKHLYFHSPEKSFKIPYAKIINLESYSNGLGVHKDGASSKPIFLEGLDSWFSCNVIENLR